MQANESEDYVMVEFDLKSVEGKQNLADDGSYDYCDDLYSIHSSGDQSNVSASDTENSVLSVPSGLLKELDEAHAAAKLAISKDSEDVTTVQSSQSVTISAPEKEEKKAIQPSVPIKSAPLSRISNKKRRKQMKLMKKAKAAAQASKALSEKATRMASSSSSVVSASKPVSKAKKTAKKGLSKRVHPHVACAHEEIAAYHNEVRMMGQKV
ncbi:MAG: hypothetical protein SGBAC_003764 [Bacillariaceae sp.]